MKTLALCLLVFSAFCSYSQDQLFKKDNTKIEVKILEINPTEIKYKLFTYQDGPTIIIAKSDVALIIYQNGSHEAFSSPAPAQQVQPMIVYAEDINRRRSVQRQNMDSIKEARFKELTLTKNLISLNMMEPLNGNIGISYLREFANGLFHVYVPVSVGVSEPMFNQPGNTIFGSYGNYSYISEYKYDRKTFETGIGFHIQTSGKRAVTHFIGPYFGIGQFTGSFKSYLYDPNGYGYQQTSSTNYFTMNRYTFMLDNGVLFRIHKNFNMMLLAGIGYHSDDYITNNPKNYTYNNNYYFNSNFSNFPINSLKLGFSLGYRF